MTHHRLFTVCAVLGFFCLFVPSCTLAKILEVGPGKTFTTPCRAIERAQAGDVVEISSSQIYRGDVCTSTVDHLTIRGVGLARARIDAAGQSAQGKATWVIAGNDTTVENIEFSGAEASDGNGAGIRQEGANLIVRNCYFHDNQEGILAGDNPKSEILIEFSEFARNGAGDGRTHNIYINHVAKFTLRFSYSHEAIVGHLVKSRAAENFILYNRLTDETDGSASFEIDLPNGGTSYVIGNIIEQGPQAQNSSILGYMLEGADPRNSGTQLYVVNNTFVNDRPQGATFLQIQRAVQTPVLVQNNIFYGKGILCTQSSALLRNNLIQKDPRFVDPAHFDYSLRPDSPARAAGTAPLQQAGFSLVPKNLYVHVACGAVRKEVPQPDLGALPFDSQAAPRVGPPRCLPSARIVNDRFGNRWQQNGPNSIQLAFTGNNPGNPQNNNRMDGYSYDAAGKGRNAREMSQMTMSATRWSLAQSLPEWRDCFTQSSIRTTLPPQLRSHRMLTSPIKGFSIINWTLRLAA